MVAVLDWVSEFWLRLYLAIFAIAGLGIAFAKHEHTSHLATPNLAVIDHAAPWDGNDAPYNIYSAGECAEGICATISRRGQTVYTRQAPDNYLLGPVGKWAPLPEAADRLEAAMSDGINDVNRMAEALLEFMSYHDIRQSTVSVSDAETILNVAAASGHAPSQEWLAVAYDDGRVFGRDAAKASYWVDRIRAL